MALVLPKDFVKETTTVTGVGPATLLGARTPAQRFNAVCSNGDTVDYAISHQTANEWEVGTGTYNANVLTRTTVTGSSNGGAAVSFSAGTKNVDLVDPAHRIARRVGPVVVGATSMGFGSINFSNGGGINWGLSTDSNGGTVTASITGGAAGIPSLALQAAGPEVLSFSTFTLSTATGPLIFHEAPAVSNASFSRVNVSWRFASSGASALVGGAALIGFLGANSTGGVGQFSAQFLSFRATNGVSFTLHDSTFANFGRIPILDISVSSLSFSNANGISFGVAGSTLTASVIAVPGVSITNLGGTGAISSHTLTNFSGSGIILNSLATSLDSAFSIANVSWRMQTTAASNVAVQAAAAIGFLGLNSTGGANLLSAQYVSIRATNGISVTLHDSTFANFGRIPIYHLSAPPQIGLVSHVGGQSVSNVTQLAFSNASNVTFSLSTAAQAATLFASVAAGGGGGGGLTEVGLYPSDATLNSSIPSATDSTLAGSSLFFRLSPTASDALLSRQNVGFRISSNSLLAIAFQNYIGGTANVAAPMVSFANTNGMSWSVGSTSFAGFGAIAVYSAAYSVPAVVNSGLLNVSASGSTVAASRLDFSNANGFTFLLSTAGSVGTISGSYTVPTLTSLSFSNLNGVTFGIAGSTLTASAAKVLGVVSHIGGTSVSDVSALVFSNAFNVNWLVSSAAGGATVRASATEVTHAGFMPYWGAAVIVTQSLSNGTFWVQPMGNSPHFSFDRMVALFGLSNATNATNSNTMRMFAGLYSRNVSTLSLISSSSTSVAFTGSGTVGNYSLFSAARHLSLGWSMSLAEGDYWVGLGAEQLTAGNNSFSVSFGQLSQSIGGGVFGFGAASNATFQSALGKGFLSATTSAPPSSIAFSQVQGTNSVAYRFPAIIFGSGTA